MEDFKKSEQAIADTLYTSKKDIETAKSKELAFYISDFELSKNDLALERLKLIAELKRYKFIFEDGTTKFGQLTH